MQAAISTMVLILMSLNLSPQGPPELRAGSFWTYSIEGEANVTMSIVEASPSDAGTALKVAVSAGGQVSKPVQVVVARDRKSIKAWMDVPSGETKELDLVMPELKVGSRWEVPGEGTVTITDVRPEPTATAAGSFPNAVRVSAVREGQPQGTVWIAPGVGLLAGGTGGKREVELTDYGPRAAGDATREFIAAEEVQLTDYGPRAVAAVGGTRITIELKDAPVVDAIMQLIKDEPVSIAFRDIPEDLRVTATIRDASPEEAVMLLCAAAGLEWEDVGRDGGVIRMPASVTVGGARVPVVGAMSVGSRVSPTVPLAIRGPVEAPWISPDRARPTFDGDDKLVDLEVKNAPIRDVMAKLSTASGFPIEVTEPVSDELKVTAKIYRMPIGDVLSMIVDQANLTYTVSYGVNENAKRRYEAGLATIQEYESARGKPEIHIVPKPELTVSGPGAQPSTSQYLRVLNDTVIRVPVEEAAPEARKSLPPILTGPTATLSLSTTCPKCGHIIMQPDWKFCPACGAKLPSSGKGKEKANRP